MKNIPKIVILVAIAVIVFVVYVLFFYEAQAPLQNSSGDSFVVSNSTTTNSSTASSTNIIPSNWKTYTVPIINVSFKAPADIKPTYKIVSNQLILTVPTTTIANTHLLREIKIIADKPAKECKSLENGPVISSKIITVDGQNFLRENWSGAAAGNIYQGIDYSLERNGLCYRVELFTHSSNGEGLYTNDAAQIARVDAQQKKDIENLFNVFDQAVSTVKFPK